MKSPLVLIVEDEVKIAQLLRDYLQESGYTTHCIGRGDEALTWALENQPDLVLLDIMLPGIDGLAVCRELRAVSDVPVIMVTARVEEIDRVLGLELGADDYICKPFSGREVVARVKAILRRVGAMDSGRGAGAYRDLVIDDERFEASIGARLLELTPVEFRILALLASDPGRVYSRQALIDNMYLDGRVVSDRTVDSHVKNLRKKLVAASGEEGWIRSIYGVGYRID